MNGPFVTVTLEIARLFEALGVPYLVGGSIASGVHGEIRYTHDVDFVAAMEPAHVEPFVASLRETYYVDESDVRAAVAGKRMFNVLRMAEGMKVDVHVRETTGFHGSELARARPIRIGEGADDRVRVATPEDTLLFKLVWFRMRAGLSDVQWRDVAGILKVHRRELDWDYLARYAAVLDVENELRRAAVEAGLQPDRG
jgi:hypothetical protein